MSIQLFSAAATDIGPRKRINQDSFYYAIGSEDDTPAGIFAVADGVSGSANGEIASRLCADALEHWWKYDFLPLEYNKSKVIASLAAKIIGINDSVCNIQSSEGGRSATTLSLLLILKDEWFTFNVGDSRVYRLKSGFVRKLDQITEDQSCLVEREYNGEKYLKSVLTSCIGGRNAFKYGYASGPLRHGDRFLICSDGVYKTMDSHEIKRILGMQGTPDTICDTFVKTALLNGEADNITAISVIC